MIFDYNFRQMKWSQELVDYTQHRFHKLEKFEFRPLQVRICFFTQRHECWAEIFVNGKQYRLHAKARSDNFFESIDRAVNKLAKQASKKKAKVMNHKCWEESASGKLARLIEEEAEETSRSTG